MQKRDDLENRILVVAKNINRNIVAEVKKYMLNKGINVSRTIMMLNNTSPIQTASDMELCLLTRALYLATKEPTLNPEQYFNERELEESEKFKYEHDEETNVMVFHNVYQIGEHQWVCPFETYQNINKHWKYANIYYNYATQRESIKKISHDDIVEKANINKKAVREITKKMLEGKFIPNAITLNVEKTGGEKFKYDPKEKTFTVIIDDDSKCAIIDGMHRCSSMMKACQQNENIKGVTIVNILNFTEEQAQEFIVQEDKRTPISKELLSTFDIEDTDMVMTKEINKEGNEKINEMFNKLSLDEKELILNNGYTTFNILASAIKFNFKYENIRESKKIKRFIIDGLNEIIGILKDKNLGDNKTNRKNTVAYNANIFIGYIALLSKLYEKDNWEDQLELIIENIDFSKENEKWNEIGLFYRNVNKTVIKKISSYFEELILE